MPFVCYPVHRQLGSELERLKREAALVWPGTLSGFGIGQWGVPDKVELRRMESAEPAGG